MVAMCVAAAPQAAPAQSLDGWELAGLGWEGRQGALDLDPRERTDARLVQFRWAGEGAADLSAFDFDGACALVADLFARIEAAGGAPAPDRIRVVATASTGGVIRLSRTVRWDYDVTGGRCLAAGEGVEL